METLHVAKHFMMREGARGSIGERKSCCGDSLRSALPPPLDSFMGGRVPSAAAAAAARDLCNLARLTEVRSGENGISQAKPLDSTSYSRLAAWLGGAGSSTTRRMATAEERSGERLPLSEVVSDCVRRWFQDTLKEARAGDVAMQVLVGQMYNSGYGVTRNIQKGKAWISKASRYRPSVAKVCEKRPGYNASDSDSDELDGEKK